MQISYKNESSNIKKLWCWNKRKLKFSRCFLISFTCVKFNYYICHRNFHNSVKLHKYFSVFGYFEDRTISKKKNFEEREEALSTLKRVNRTSCLFIDSINASWLLFGLGSPNTGFHPAGWLTEKEEGECDIWRARKSLGQFSRRIFIAFTPQSDSGIRSLTSRNLPPSGFLSHDQTKPEWALY